MVSKASLVSLVWLAIAAMVVTVAVSLVNEDPSTSAALPPTTVVSGNLNVTGVGNINGTTDPPTLCGSLDAAKATGCGYLTPSSADGNITAGKTTVPVNVPLNATTQP